MPVIPVLSNTFFIGILLIDQQFLGRVERDLSV